MTVRHVAAIAAAVVLTVAASADRAVAQRPVTAQVGVGTALDPRHDRLQYTLRHLSAALEVTPPALGLGVRADVTWIAGSATQPIPGLAPADAVRNTTSASLSGVVGLAIPVVRPYALAGWARYGIGGSDSRSGAVAGVGLRLTAGPLRVFGEARRHWVMHRDLVTFGIAF